jgi:CBS domain-containing protein
MALTVRDIMDADPVTALPGDNVEALVRRLREHELPGAPVIDDGGGASGSSRRRTA